MNGFGVLIQMKFTLSMVNRLGMLKSNILKIRKSILMLVIFVLVAGFICKQVLNVSFAFVIELCD